MRESMAKQCWGGQPQKTKWTDELKTVINQQNVAKDQLDEFVLNNLLAQYRISDLSEKSGKKTEQYTLVQMTTAQLHGLRDDWSALAQNSADSNVFYEPWYFLPAMEHFGQQEKWNILGVVAESKGESRLVGFFPFVERRNWIKGTRLELWKHPFAYLTTPLVERGIEAAVLDCVAQHLQTEHRGAVVSIPQWDSGSVGIASVEVLRDRLLTVWQRDEYLRAIMYRSDDWEQDLNAVVDGHHRREYRRQRRKLGEQGQLEFRVMKDTSAVSHWIEWFLELESQSWKATHGTAMKQDEQAADFFRDIIQAGAERDQVQMMGLFLDGTPIALKCNLVSAPGSFAFKIAYDANYRKYSPGVLLEFDNMRYFNEQTSLKWMDSCAAPNHPMINRIWPQRRLIRHSMITSGEWKSECRVAVFAGLRAMNRIRKRMKPKSGTTQDSQKP